MTAGLRHVFTDAVLAPVALDFFVFLLALGMVNVAEVFFVIRTLHGTPLAYGALGAAFSVGTIAGSLFGRRLSQDLFAMTRLLLGSVVLAGLSVTAVSFVVTVGQIYPLMIVAGVTVGVINLIAMSLMTLRTAEALRGRTFAAVNAITQSAQVGAFLLGGLALSAYTPRAVYRFGGAAATVAAILFGLVALRGAARLRDADGAAPSRQG